ncbi:MAG: GntR family transcriptional regulator [Peptococcaceae bacterium]|jgi:GntR family transcriptional regulator|nr:GntR family transcriptional regulator [Peptococcaceae bacterium]MBQ2013599.1 GntR family transcriptional regulator [Peptococcaceae bacterium]MBQ2448741.1 GntR family transcriptional regulator [Peptococcaceae bacterium]MBQ5683295.1 GntR family transcriptional regulator [Peptococcaceae bacterium]MBQ5857884.1 GntR family transcriptional regulator [Peptococcaceae bacterium]
MILIDYKSRKPIYEQIIENMKQLVVSGALKRDEQIPSVRQLAQELAINPNTIQKAYAELERQGVIYSLKGRGSFVGSSLQELRNIQQNERLEELAALSKELYRLQVPQEELYLVIQQVYKQQKEDEIHD